MISVLDRTKEPGSIGEPLYLDVVAALQGTEFANCTILSGRYGLGSKDTTPSQIVAVYNNVDKKRFTIGIDDDDLILSSGNRSYGGYFPDRTGYTRVDRRTYKSLRISYNLSNLYRISLSN